MTLEHYSNLIKTTRRGSNAFRSPYGRKMIGYRAADKLKGRTELYPVLDVGCGLGYFVQACTEAGIPCVGVDLDQRQLKYANTRMRRHGLKPGLFQADARKLPFKDGSFGYVHSSGMLMMIPFVRNVVEGRLPSAEETSEDIKKVLSEMRRVIRVNGEIRIITFSDKEQLEPKYYKPKLEELEQLAMEVGLEPHVDYHRRWPTFIDATLKKV